MPASPVMPNATSWSSLCAPSRPPRACITNGSAYATGHLFPSAKPIGAQESQAQKSSAFSAALASLVAEARLQRQGTSSDGDVRKAGGLVELELAEL